MSLAARLRTALDGLRRRRPLPVWYHEGYRLPLPDGREALGLETRRADMALWGLLGARNRRLLEIHEPGRASFGELQLVHDDAWLERLTRPRDLAQVFGLDREDFPVGPVLTTVRLAVRGTVAATRHALERGGPTLNLLGGFHHAFPDRGTGFCPVNDLAIALAAARAEGFDGDALVLDLDAHPPDGTAACLEQDERAWIGSISGSDWGPLPGVDETVLPGADDATYLAALRDLLGRLRRPRLAFVLAGGDVLAGDRLGTLKLTPAGVQERDRLVAAWLDDLPSVWVPAGGYQAEAWRVVARTAGVLIGRGFRPVPDELDPIASHFAYVSRSLDAATLHGGEPWITQEEVDAMFGARSGARDGRLLGYYTADGIEHALWAYGFLPLLHRLGYRAFQVEISRGASGDRAQLTGSAGGERHLLWEIVVDRETVAGHPVLFLNWMTMRHPRGAFDPRHPRLPGQEVPGLGLADEAMALLVRVCGRLDLDGILLRPAWLHVAAMGHPRFRFVDPAHEGRFQALLRDLHDVPLRQLTEAAAAGRLTCDGEPWTWRPEPMVLWTRPHAEDEAAVATTRDATRFTLAP
ncbi:MAG: histone deacetylase [Alphaproteobacteria bacterium]|nr:histone deacetylase [Alphaproteobacteria bacterium]